MMFQVIKNNKAGKATKEVLFNWIQNVYLSEKWEQEKLVNKINQIVDEIFSNSNSSEPNCLSLEEFKNLMNSRETLWNENFNFREILTKLADL